ncbi:MAG TPA: hypothetical protein VK041_10900, partial [Opitutales bacterium]|nr:hypothetical protein [Opitutales bacterium]
WVDYTGRIEEGNKSNNLWWADSADVRLLTSLSLADVLGLELTHPDGWRIGGDAAWSGQVGEFDRSVPGNNGAAQSPLLKPNEKAWFEAEIEGPALLDFSWKVSSKENYNFLRLYVSGSFEKEISGEVDWEEGGPIFIPAGPQTIRYSYEKTSADNEHLDAGWVDNIRLTEVTKPDLVITSVEYEPGSYILDRDRLSVTVVAENRGAPFPPGMIWETSDIEVRLSSNRIVGDEDDVILGDFARVETFESGARLVFSGDLYLPHDPELPDRNRFEGDYYLIAKVDALSRIDEFDHENNIWIGDSNDIFIRRLPHLISDQFTFDSARSYFPYAPLEVDWLLRNRGLGDISGDTPYLQKIQLFAVDRDDPNFEDPIFVGDLSVFSEDAYLPGVSSVHPNGGSIPVHSRFTLPSPAEILAGLGEVEEGLEEEDPRVLARLSLMELSYLYYLAIVTDAAVAIEQSSDLRVAHYNSDLFVIRNPVTQPVSYDQWRALYPDLDLSDPNEISAGDQLPNLMKYAFDLNPRLPHPAGAALYNAFGVRDYEGKDYLRITFNMVSLATDLRYVVEVSDDLSTWTPLVILEPPYEDFTKEGRLISHPLVVAASDQGHTAAVTVRDAVSVDDAPVRFLRLRVEER